MLTVALEPKRLELLRKLVSNADVIGVIVDPNSPDTVQQMKYLTAAAGAVSQQLRTMNVSGENDAGPHLPRCSTAHCRGRRDLLAGVPSTPAKVCCTAGSL